MTNLLQEIQGQIRKGLESLENAGETGDRLQRRRHSCLKFQVAILELQKGKDLSRPEHLEKFLDEVVNRMFSENMYFDIVHVFESALGHSFHTSLELREQLTSLILKDPELFKREEDTEKPNVDKCYSNDAFLDACLKHGAKLEEALAPVIKSTSSWIKDKMNETSNAPEFVEKMNVYIDREKNMNQLLSKIEKAEKEIVSAGGASLSVDSENWKKLFKNQAEREAKALKEEEMNLSNILTKNYEEAVLKEVSTIKEDPMNAKSILRKSFDDALRADRIAMPPEDKEALLGDIHVKVFEENIPSGNEDCSTEMSDIEPLEIKSIDVRNWSNIVSYFSLAQKDLTNFSDEALCFYSKRMRLMRDLFKLSWEYISEEIVGGKALLYHFAILPVKDYAESCRSKPFLKNEEDFIVVEKLFSHAWQHWTDFEKITGCEDLPGLIREISNDREKRKPYDYPCDGETGELSSSISEMLHFLEFNNDFNDPLTCMTIDGLEKLKDKLLSYSTLYSGMNTVIVRHVEYLIRRIHLPFIYQDTFKSFLKDMDFHPQFD